MLEKMWSNAIVYTLLMGGESDTHTGLASEAEDVYMCDLRIPSLEHIPLGILERVLGAGAPSSL